MKKLILLFVAMGLSLSFATVTFSAGVDTTKNSTKSSVTTSGDKKEKSKEPSNRGGRDSERSHSGAK